MALLILEHQVEEIISNNPRLVSSWVVDALLLHFNKLIIQPQKTYLQISDNPYDRIIALPAYIKGENEIAGIKWIGSHSQNTSKGLHRANAIIIINDAKTMIPQAIVEGSLISSMRTFAISMIAFDKFLPDNANVGIIGMGRLGRMHAQFLGKEYPKISSIYCYSMKANFDDLINYPKVIKAQNLEELLRNCNVLITTTNAKEPYINELDLRSDIKLIINLSLMDFNLSVIEKSEIVIVDDWEQNTKANKVFKQGVDSGSLKRGNVIELGEILSKSFNESHGRIFINPLGMGIEDIYVAKKVYELIISTN